MTTEAISSRELFSLSGSDPKPTYLPCPDGSSLRVRVDGGSLFCSAEKDVASHNFEREIEPTDTATFTTPVWVRAGQTETVQVLVETRPA